jgi:hypothetical protein
MTLHFSEKYGESFAIIQGGQRHPVIIWSVTRTICGCRVVRYSLRPEGVVVYKALAKYTVSIEE